MSPEIERAHSELELYPVERLLSRLESGSKEIVPGKFVRVSTYGAMSHIPSLKPHPPKKQIRIAICEACNQLQTEVDALITIEGTPKVLSIAKRIGRTTLVIHDGEKAMLNRDMIRDIERDLKAYIKLRDQDEAPAVHQIQQRISATAVQIAAAVHHFEKGDRKNGKKGGKKRK